MTRLSPAEIDRVRARHRLIDVLARAGVLEDSHPTTGRDFMISCPTPGHDDRTPSCVIHPVTDRFYCFGCGAHGDVFELMTGLTGVSSLGQISEMLDAGGPISARPGAVVRRGSAPAGITDGGPDPSRTPDDVIFACNGAAWAFLTASPRADHARDYLRKRGVDVSSIEAVGGRPLVGSTAAGHSELTRHLARTGFGMDEIVDSGWTLRTEDGPIDRFRGRVLFPVLDGQGRVAGVIGRDVTGRAARRYLNTPRTVVYNKSELLYRPAVPVTAAPTVVVCEGPIDALAITAAAIAQELGSQVMALSPSGAALTSHQAQRVVAMTANPPVLCADADAAGATAAHAWASTFSRLDRKSHTVTLPPGHDPASWLTETGPAGLAQLLPRLAPVVARRDLAITL